MKYLKNIFLLLIVSIAHADTSPDVFYQDCKSACTTNEQGKEVLLNQVCGTDTSATNITTSTHVVFNDYNDCKNTVEKELGTGILSSQCTNLKLIEKDIELEIASVALFSAAAASCLTACIASLSPLEILSPILEGACTALGITATGLDITSTLSIEKDASIYKQELVSESITSDTTGAIGSTIALGATGRALNNTGYVKKFLDSMKSSFEKITGSVKISKTIDDAAEEATESAEKENAKVKADNKDKGLICASAFLLAATSAIKGAAFSHLKKSEKASCAMIRNLKDYGSNKNNKLPNAVLTKLGTAGSLSANGQSTGENNLLKDQNQGNQNSPSPTPPSLAAMAASTPLSNSLGPLGTIADNQLTPISSAINALKNGSSPINALSAGMPNTPQDVQKVLENMHKLAEHGALAMDGIPHSGEENAKRGSSEPTDIGTSKGNLSKKGPDPTKTVNFANKNPKLSQPNSTDIWHTHEKATIFTIVSQRLKLSENQVEKLPWMSPLNKALQTNSSGLKK